MQTTTQWSPAVSGDPSKMRAPGASGSPVRVMHVVYSLQPGGMELGVVKLVNGLDPAAVRSAICSTTPNGALRPHVSPAVPVYELQRRQGNDPALVWQMYRLFRSIEPDVVHTHAWGTLVEGLVAARMARVPVVVHGEHGTLQLRPHQRWVQRRAWASVDHVLSVSSRLAERIARDTGFPLGRIRTIRNGVDLSRFSRADRDAARGALGLSADTLVAVAVGRLVPVKDHMTLLESMALLRSRDVDVTLVVAGDGPLRVALTGKAASLGIGAAVRFIGHRTDVDAVFASGDVFVQSSESEGLSNTILEAMASGLPVVATCVGGADEMVQHGETGLLVEPRSAAALAAALADVLGDPARARAMGTAGRRRAESEFSLAGMIRRYEALYREAVAAAPRNGVRGRALPARLEQSGVA